MMDKWSIFTRFSLLYVLVLLVAVHFSYNAAHFHAVSETVMSMKTSQKNFRGFNKIIVICKTSFHVKSRMYSLLQLSFSLSLIVLKITLITSNFRQVGICSHMIVHSCFIIGRYMFQNSSFAFSNVIWVYLDCIVYTLYSDSNLNCIVSTICLGFYQGFILKESQLL